MITTRRLVLGGPVRDDQGLFASLVFTFWVLWTSWAIKLETPSDPADPRTATPVGA